MGGMRGGEVREILAEERDVGWGGEGDSGGWAG